MTVSCDLGPIHTVREPGRYGLLNEGVSLVRQRSQHGVARLESGDLVAGREAISLRRSVARIR